MKLSTLRASQIAAASLLAVLALTACGGDGQPFIMDVNSTLFVGNNPGQSPLALLVDPIQENPTGSLEAQINREFSDHFELDVLSFNLAANFAGVGDIQFVLDPNLPSQMSVSKLNSNNQQIMPNVLNLSLIIETPDQNLTLSNLLLQSNTALLQLSENLPPLGFFVNGQPFAIQIANLNILIPSDLIVSDFDPQ
jgi:hypothetical protein